MIRVLMEKEIRERLLSVRFRISYLVISTLILLSFVMGYENYESGKRAYDAGLAQHERTISEHTNWGDVDHKVFLPPMPLSVLVSGVSNDIGQTINIEGRGELLNTGSKFNDQPIFAVFRLLDLQFIFTVILTLFAVVLSFDAINGEREQGTLQLIFAQSVSRAAYIAGKVSGILAALILPLLLPVLIGCLYLYMRGLPLSPQSWLQLGLIIGTGICITSILVLLSVGMSALFYSSSSSFVAMLVVWIFMVIILPKSAVILSDQWVDVPNIDEIATQKASYRMQLFRDDQDAMESFSAAPGADIQETMSQFQKHMAALSEKRNEKASVHARKLNEGFENAIRDRQEKTYRLISLSPVATSSLAMTMLSGTSLGLRSQFLDQAENYRDVFNQFVESETGDSPRSGIRIVLSDDEEKEPIDLTKMPVFEFAGYDAKQAIEKAGNQLGILAAWLIGSFLFAWISFVKTDIK